MHIGRITGTITATIKADILTGSKLLLVDLVDAKGKVLAPAKVAIDQCGAGKGDLVLISQGSAARLLPHTAGHPIDMAVVAIIDQLDH